MCLAKNSQEYFPFSINSRTEDDEVNEQEHKIINLNSKYEEVVIDSKVCWGIVNYSYNVTNIYIYTGRT